MIGNKISYDITFIIIQLPHRSLFLLNKMLLSIIPVRVFVTYIYFLYGMEQKIELCLEENAIFRK